MIDQPHCVSKKRPLTLAGAVIAAAAAVFAAPPAEAAIIVTTADVEVDEGDNSRNNGTSINSRTSAGINEVMVYRFDLTGVDRASISDATLNLVNFRNNTARTIQAWGVADGATGTSGSFDDNNWDEATVLFSTMPGLAYDADAATDGIAAGATDLGTFNITAASLKGTTNSFNSPAITTFLQSHPDDIVTIIVRSTTVSTGQARIASREANALDGGTPTGAVGDFAATLQFNVPEPGSLGLVGLAAMGLARRRRRR